MLKNLIPSECIPPHGVARHDDVIDFANEFDRNGWSPSHPVLVGYPWEGKVQLLSGSHRWAAAKMAGLESIPVLVYSYDTISKAWGTKQWKLIMKSGELHDYLER